MSMWRSLALCAVALLAAPLPARGANAKLELDGFSFFFFEGAQVGAQLPGASVPISVTPAGKGRWTLSVDAADLKLPEVVYPSGRRVQWRLGGPATGEVVKSGGTFVATLQAPALAYVDGASDGISMALSFSTETANATAAGLTASRQGVPLDPASGYLQLVAAGVNPSHAATAPGKPFYAVLSGRIVGVDFSK
jgi:hypothetical protein